MSRIIGIDLGTTNSCVAVLEGGEAVVVPNAEGARTTPSMVAATDSGERLVGQIAKRQAVTNPSNTVFAVKRLMGRKIDNPELEPHLERYPYAIVPSENDDAWVELGGKAISPIEVSSFVLARMKEIAEAYLGEEVTDAVITVPAYFNDHQRQGTKDAGRVAGLNVLRIVNEPTAAALAYGLDREGIRYIAVYDLGGGTFDISILEVGQGLFEVRATSGDTWLGGEDFDMRLLDHLIEVFKEREGLDLSEDKMALQRLKEAAEKAKHELSSALETEINLPFIAADDSGPKHLEMHLTRGDFEGLVEDLVDRTLKPCEQALEDAGISIDAIDAVVLVGGMTRMPLVQQRVESFFRRAPSRGVNPDEVVAVGAAIQGGVLSGEVEDVILLDVTPLSLGVETKGGVFTRMIERNTTIPYSMGQVFSTAVDNQPMVSVHVLQGEREMADDNQSLARFDLTGLPPAPRGVPQIEVTFELDVDGILNVAARDLGTGREQRVEVRISSGLNEDAIDQMIADAEQHRLDDEHRKALIELRNQAEGLMYTTERSLSEYGEVIPESDQHEIRADVDTLRESLISEDLEELKLAIQNLEQSAYRIADAIYGEVPEQSPEG